jgi:hypothetical protein
MRALLCGSYNPALMLRQTPGGLGRWEDVEFALGDTISAADWLIVVDEPRPFVRTTLPRERRILFITEPGDTKQYPASYLSQFGTVVSPTVLRRYRGRHMRRHPALPWWLGAGHFFDLDRSAALSYEDLLGAPVPEKRQLLSVVCSTHIASPTHRRRIEFVKHIKAYFGDTLHWYGRGVHTMRDKAEAILPYRYHIALENSKIDHFWTEKLADCFLGYAFPIYSGGRNVADYFPTDTFEAIDIDDYRGAINVIENVLKTDPWEQRLPAIAAARYKVLTDFNFFNECCEILRGIGVTNPPTKRLAEPETLYPVPLPFRLKLKAWERRHRRRIRALLERKGLVRPHKNKWKEFADNAVPDKSLAPSMHERGESD